MEIEIKLGPVSHETAEAVFSDEEIRPFLSQTEEIEMETAFFDREGALAREKYTLRLRRENGHGVCTFKAPAEGGRLELEEPAETVKQGVARLLLRPELPRKALEILLCGGLKSGCGARFTRKQARYSRDGLSFVLSVDFGLVFAGEKSAPIAEIELELVSGGRERLQEAAGYIMNKYKLKEIEKSKHQRAQELMHQPAGPGQNPAPRQDLSGTI